MITTGRLGHFHFRVAQVIVVGRRFVGTCSLERHFGFHPCSMDMWMYGNSQVEIEVRLNIRQHGPSFKRCLPFAVVSQRVQEHNGIASPYDENSHN